MTTQSYVEAFVVVNGALEDQATFDADNAQELLETWLTGAKEEAMAHPDQRTEIYLTEHGHSPDVEDCSCVQYLQDHHPFWAFPQNLSES